MSFTGSKIKSSPIVYGLQVLDIYNNILYEERCPSSFCLDNADPDLENRLNLRYSYTSALYLNDFVA